MTTSKAQIIATIGPASSGADTLRAMVGRQMDAVRFNFSWGDFDMRGHQIRLIRELEEESGRKVLIIIDLPGPRIQSGASHTYDTSADGALTEYDKESLRFAVEHAIDYIALSFVAGTEVIEEARQLIADFGGNQKIIAKIERKDALENLDDIINTADAIMIARGDLGNEVPLEQIPFVQEDIIKRCNAAGKPVIVATGMLLSMVENPTPTRAEVTDVAEAIRMGADAVMLSEETAMGKHPTEAVAEMERIVVESERHADNPIHSL